MEFNYRRHDLICGHELLRGMDMDGEMKGKCGVYGLKSS